MDGAADKAIEIRVGEDSALDLAVQEAKQLNSKKALRPDFLLDDYWYYSNSVDPQKWDQYLPYQLIVVEAREVEGSESENGSSQAGVQYSVWDHPPRGKWVFTLPIAPQVYDMTTPFAINLKVTQGGITEEHNGAPIRVLTLQGTTGVLPLRTEGDSYATGIFSDIARAADAIGDAAGALAGNFTDSALSPRIIEKDLFDKEQVGEDQNSLMKYSSGYYQFHRLEQFLQDYITAKKSVNGRDLRLAFASWKDESVYLVTPEVFRLRRSVPDPYEYPYTLSFKVWKKIQLDGKIFRPALDPSALDPGFFATALSVLNSLIGVIDAVGGLIDSVVGFVDSVVNIVRGVAAAIRSVGNAIRSVLTMPARIIDSIKDGIADISDAISDAEDAIKDGLESLGIVVGDVLEAQDVIDFFSSPSTSSTQSSSRGLSIQNLLDFDKIQLPIEVKEEIEVEAAALENPTKSELLERRAELVEIIQSLEVSLGVSDETYVAAFGGSNGPQREGEGPSDAEMSALYGLYDLLTIIDGLIARNSGELRDVENARLDLMATLSRASGISFQNPNSQILVPFSESLERMALVYLQNPDRWHEIAALNNLQYPYVDEEGVEVPLTMNGKGNEVVVKTPFSLPDYFSNSGLGEFTPQLHTGQIVRVRSKGVVTIRRIIGIREMPGSGGENFLVVSLSGPPDMATYRVEDGAVLHFFLPNTTNSQQSIFVPSLNPPTPNDVSDNFIEQNDLATNLDEFGKKLVRTGGADLRLTTSGDLFVDPNTGSPSHAVGVQNIIQRVLNALNTTRGSIVQHPSYGIRKLVGRNTSDLSPRDVVVAVQDALADDPAFVGTPEVSVLKKGPVMSVIVVPTLKEGDLLTPIYLSLSGGKFSTSSSSLFL